jgi:hypothetical protein
MHDPSAPLALAPSTTDALQLAALPATLGLQDSFLVVATVIQVLR